MPPLERRGRDRSGVFPQLNVTERKIILTGKTRPRLDWSTHELKVNYLIAPLALTRGHAPFPACE